MYHFEAEIHEIGTSRTFTEDVPVEAVSEERAREFAEHRLEEVYPGEDFQLLSLECIGVEENA
jgi:hypothetical protein